MSVENRPEQVPQEPKTAPRAFTDREHALVLLKSSARIVGIERSETEIPILSSGQRALLFQESIRRTGPAYRQLRADQGLDNVNVSSDILNNPVY